MKRLRSVFLLLLLLPFILCLVPSSSAKRSDEDEARLAVFDDVWETIRDRYYDPEFHGVDWEAAREKFRPLAAHAESTRELYTVLRRMLGSLRDPHTRVFAPDEKFDWRRPRFIGVGLSVREVGGLPVVVAVERGSEAERAGLRAGDVVAAVDDEPALDLFARRLKEQAASPDAASMRFQVMARLFEGPQGSTVSVRWLGADGRERTTTLRREWRERDSSLRVRRVRGEIGVVEFDIFTEEVAASLVRALDRELRDVRGLVVDLRYNGGGETEAMTEVASAFLPAGRSLGRFTDRRGRLQFEPHTRAALLFAPDRIKTFRGPVIILTSERTSSAAEIFVAALKEAGRATTVGQSTCGCVLAIRRQHALPDGGELSVSEMDYQTAAGFRLEGAGLVPDELVTLDRQDLRARRDRAFERAVERLRPERP
ncbi:MAG TPA: S41 family peptidase [Pyrinomonadaceae bacterium]|nr:S41 family peptidase [Pyrinomonadaceae bacterium]